MAIVFRDQPGPTGIVRKPAKGADGQPAGRKGLPAGAPPAIVCRGFFLAAATGGAAAPSRPARRRG